MVRKISIQTVSFAKAGDATEFFKRILNSYRVGERVSDSDSKHLQALLERHDDKDEKVGGGIDYFEVNKPPDDFGGKCFWIVRLDGSKTDFSYTHCLKRKSYD